MKSTDGSEQSEPDLNFPDRDWAGFFRNHFGPSLLWALIGIGGSHVVLAPTVGARFGFFGVLLFLLVYVLKYGGWTLGIRYNYATGRNPLRDYDSLPGPSNWALWMTLVVFGVFYLMIAAAVGVGAAALLASLVPLSEMVLYPILMVLAAALVGIGRYGQIEKILIGLTLILVALILPGAVLSWTEPETLRRTAFRLPDLSAPGVLALIVGVVGFAPTGHSTSLLVGSWSLAKNPESFQGDGPPEGVDRDRYVLCVRDWIEVGLRDFRIAYAFSLIVALSMVLVAVSVLYPEPLADEDFAVRFGRILSESLGEWSYYAVVLGSFAALYSTVLTMYDGTVRALVELSECLLGEVVSERRRLVRRGFVAWFFLAATLPVVLIGPGVVSFVVWISAVTAITEVVYYPANWYLVKANLPSEFQPPEGFGLLHLVSVLFVTGSGILAALVRLGVVP